MHDSFPVIEILSVNHNNNQNRLVKKEICEPERQRDKLVSSCQDRDHFENHIVSPLGEGYASQVQTHTQSLFGRDAFYSIGRRCLINLSLCLCLSLTLHLAFCRTDEKKKCIRAQNDSNAVCYTLMPTLLLSCGCCRMNGMALTLVQSSNR